MSQATIVLTVRTDAPVDRKHLSALIAAARDGFKVDGWEVSETSAIYGQPFSDYSVGNFEQGDPVWVHPYEEGVSFEGLDPDRRQPPHTGSGGATVETIDPADGTVQVSYDGTAVEEWVHHTSLELQ